MSLRYALVLSTMLLVSGMARADTFNTFFIDATLESGSVTGTVTLDETTGIFTASAITAIYYGSTYNFFGPPTLIDKESTFNRTHFGGSVPNYAFGVTVPLPSLVGYTGGSLCDESHTCGGFTSAVGTGATTAVDAVISGSLVLVSTPTPEPSSFALLGTGLLGVVGIMRKRVLLSR